METLVLSNTYSPLRVVAWQKAVGMLFDGKVEVVSEYDEDIRSVRLSLKMPAVVRFVRRHAYRFEGPKFTRGNVLLRDARTCQYCGYAPRSLSELNFDHVVPRARGGATSWENIVTACVRCNTKKACRTPSEAGMTLRRVPVRPRWLPFAATRSWRSVPEAWQAWLASDARAA